MTAQAFPDVLGVGYGECRCGLVVLSNVRGVTYVDTGCPECRTWVRVLPMEPAD